MGTKDSRAFIRSPFLFQSSDGVGPTGGGSRLVVIFYEGHDGFEQRFQADQMIRLPVSAASRLDSATLEAPNRFEAPCRW